MSSTRGECIVYIARNKLQLLPRGRPAVSTIEMPKDVISDLEIINRDGLSVLISNLVKQQSIASFSILIILSRDVCFEKDLPDTTLYLSDEALRTFLDTVPFEHLATKVLKQEKGIRLVAVNKDLYEEIGKAFEKERCTIFAVIPEAALIRTGETHELDLATGSSLLDRFDTMRQYSMHEGERSAEIEEKKKKSLRHNRTFMILLAVSLYLLAIGLIVLWIKTSPSIP